MVWFGLVGWNGVYDFSGWFISTGINCFVITSYIVPTVSPFFTESNYAEKCNTGLGNKP